jgi:hypothetical protein
MKSAFWRTMALIAVVAMPTMAAANDATIGSEAAHSSMGGTTLNNTTAIFNAFPHLVVFNGTGAEIVSQSLVGGADDSGRGRVWWEAYDGLWLNLNVGRLDYGGQAANFMWGGNRAMEFFVPSFFGDAAPGYSGLDHPWINVGIAKPTSNGGAWAANLFFGADSEDDGEFKNSSTGFGGLFSWGNGDGLHVSAEVAMQSETLETADPDDEGSFLNFSVNARKDTDLYIYQGSFVFGSGNGEGEEDGEVDESVLGFYGSAGRFLKNAVDGQTSIEFFLAYITAKFEVGDAEDKFTSFVLPGVRVAAWEKISDRFGIMGSVYGAYSMDKEEETFEGDTGEFKTASFDYDWTAGLFFQPTDNVRIDFQFNKEELGQVLSLGNEEPLVWYLGATVGLN